MKDAERIKIKICGMRQQGNILDIADLHPDYMGFIFYEGSKRFVGNNFSLPILFPPSVQRIGVFVNATTQEILWLANLHTLDFVQLHGTESVEQCIELRKKGLNIIKAFGIGDDFDFKVVSPYKKTVDYFLFDTKGKNFGGNGAVFDWAALKEYDQSVPFFLSGGISLRNIKGVRAVEGMNLHAVDVNSGVESEAGIKDVELVRRLMETRI